MDSYSLILSIYLINVIRELINQNKFKLFFFIIYFHICLDLFLYTILYLSDKN